MGKTMALKPISGLKRNRAHISSSTTVTSPVAQAMSHTELVKSAGWLDGLLDKGIASQMTLGKEIVSDLAARCKSDSKASTSKGKTQVKEMQSEAEAADKEHAAAAVTGRQNAKQMNSAVKKRAGAETEHIISTTTELKDRAKKVMAAFDKEVDELGSSL